MDLKGVIRIEDMPKPKAMDNQVLIKVYNSSINYADHAMLVGHLEEAFLHYKSRKTCGKIAVVLEEEV